MTGRDNVAKPEWGSKRTCQSCATVFYDFRRDPIVCPNCGATVEPEQPVKSRRSRNGSKPKPAAKAAVVAEAEDDTAAEETDDLLLDSDDEDADETASEDVDTSLVDSDEIDVDIDDDDEEDDAVLAADDDDDDEDVQGIVDTGDGVDDELTK